MITARPIATRYDTPDNSPVTVATPSCCCCCCCIATIAGVVTFSAKQFSNEKTNNDGSGFAPWLGALALPVAIGVMVALGSTLRLSVPVGLAGAVAFVAIYAGAYVLAGGANAVRAFVTPVLVLVVAGALAVAELFAVLFSAGVGWLVLIPLEIWAGYKIADSVTPSNYRPMPYTNPSFIQPPLPGAVPHPFGPDPIAPHHGHEPPVGTGPPHNQGPPLSPPVTPRPPDLDFWQPPSQSEDNPPPQDPFS